MERVDFTGDSPQARFGHTITPIAKDKAILFGGAVGDTGNPSFIKANMLSQGIPFFVTTLSANGANSTVMGRLLPTALHTPLSLSITSSSYSGAHLGVASLPMMVYTS